MGLWFGPVVVLLVVAGQESVFVDVAWFFSTAAVLTFGGAYSVLAYISQEAVNTFGWLEPGEMTSGLGMAETTPGPLIQVVQFVGFMGPYRNPGALSPIQAGIFGAVMATWVTFVPSFLWIFLGAPFTLFDTVDERRGLGAVIYQPDLGSPDWAALAIAALSAIAIFRFKTPALKVVSTAAALGIAHQFLLA